MRVRLSPGAASYVRQEAAYLRQYSRAAAAHFADQIKSVRQHLKLFTEAGFADAGLPMPGMRRLVRDGFRIDYRLLGGVIEIVAISHSVNSPLIGPSDDPDFDGET
ncbi:type II toxin-antitoxin system RelE/ParE family toxin [Devosia sp. XJ19-1]|uniref:Type II toxin-antitoxin system RelE/ParE family toxin n=1 Tax=Devosia ureilytica TaxID=2952754 RepID=A0A9Q4ASU1_9HYPH|nr:type II toxin-antitoxin system RelE/ParE family toxin [Devosia ureilytica]MCP8885378.1 type II toxin-antitoxin system RelE/ParE family toxin [Devosia ureilytica]MCP8888946.1 type II toxin-antitoxin system RelE/ParE family toxin [Devosia ureilytica]